MFVRTVVAVTLFTSLLGAADSSPSDIFSVRSFTDPKTKAKIPVNAKLFAEVTEKSLKQALKEAVDLGNGECAIPLQEAKTAKTKDRISQPGGSSFDSGGVMKAPIAACKNWN